ncbi:hypothetical protein BDW69DRAFT_177459 [Aspergillus filifer]
MSKALLISIALDLFELKAFSGGLMRTNSKTTEAALGFDCIVVPVAVWAAYHRISQPFPLPMLSTRKKREPGRHDHLSIDYLQSKRHDQRQARSEFIVDL